MEIIGEKISVTSSRVAKAMKNREIGLLLELAKKQVEAGITFLDLNIGPATKDGPELMEWLVTEIQKEVDVPISLDCTNLAAIEAGLKVHKGQAIINSASGQTGRKEPMFELAGKYNAKLIGLCMTDEGIPRDENERCVVAFDLITLANQYGIANEDLYLDPLILPIGIQQDQAIKSVNSIAMFKELADPPTKSTVGLSNVYNGCEPAIHAWVGGTFLAMLLEAGLTTPIADPNFTELLEVAEKAKQLLADPALEDSDEDFKKIAKTIKVIRGEVLFSNGYLD
ncbi:MAG: dihydropteroate synthase DHPS [Actinobacteria bacterium]|nr:MAG: dihydropteroate synthase DHPS [Actinomycetota bacterium]